MPSTHTRKNPASRSRNPATSGGTRGVTAVAVRPTSFFRDAAAFDELGAKVLSSVVRQRTPDDPIRIWVPGCSTGEEAYSIAIVLAEQLAAAPSVRRVQIFATDVDADALRIARAGSYPGSIARDVSPRRLDRFFTHTDRRYTVSRAIRESVVFGVHDLLSDAPLLKIDLVSCRNVLAGFAPQMRDKLVALLHFALNPGGYLFLGRVEDPGALKELFAPVAKRWRIYQRLGPVAASAARKRQRGRDKGVRWLDLLAHHAADVLERRRAEAMLTRSQQELQTRVADRTRWLSLMHDVARAINEAPTWDGALHQVLSRLCETEDWQIGYVYLPEPGAPDVIAPVVSCGSGERFRPFHVASEQQRYARGQSLPGRVYAENTPFWSDDPESLLTAVPKRAHAAREAGLKAGVALPIVTQGEVLAVMELFSDHVHPPNPLLATLMHDVGDQIGRVIERERATARMADLVWREQQDLLHTLHDSLGQTLTGLGMLSAGLRRRLADCDPASAETAAEIARQAQHALDEVRLLARGLFPVEVEADSLMAALRDLASATEVLHTIRVSVEGSAPRGLRDGNVATHLYRITQEAVTNSVKHGHASTITIQVASAAGLLRLRIADDGSGIRGPHTGNGTGLRIMRHRAASIGASLTIEPGAAGGTVVTCTVRTPPPTPRAQA